MPIIVDELVITVELGGAGAAAPGGPSAPEDRPAWVAEVVAEAVAQVLEVLRQREEP